jgi:flagellar protein FliJ
MKKSQRMHMLVDIKESQEKKALEALGETQRKLLALQTQLDNLILYRQGYQEQFTRLGSSGVKVAQLLEFRSFIGKLDQAIAGQQQAMQTIERELASKRKVWEALRHHCNGLQKVRDSARVSELKQADKAEQGEQDERGARFGRNSLNGMINAD